MLGSLIIAPGTREGEKQQTWRLKTINLTDFYSAILLVKRLSIHALMNRFHALGGPTRGASIIAVCR